MEDKFLTIEDVADHLGVHTKTIRRYLYSGKISGQKVGSQWRISQKALEAFLKSGEANCGHHSAVPSSEDFCVYMDTDMETFSNDRRLRICTIIDYDVTSPKEISPLSIALMQAIETAADCEDCRFNHVYEPREKRVRFVLWASPEAMVQVMAAMQPFDQKKIQNLNLSEGDIYE